MSSGGTAVSVSPVRSRICSGPVSVTALRARMPRAVCYGKIASASYVPSMTDAGGTTTG